MTYVVYLYDLREGTIYVCLYEYDVSKSYGYLCVWFESIIRGLSTGKKTCR